MRTVEEIEKKVFSFIEEHHMLQAGYHVVAGVSGGADSVCLLFVLLQYRKKVPFEISVVHMDHKIRKESGEDAAYVRRLCEQEGIPFFLYERDINAIALERKCSTEEAGRIARYEAFYEVAQKMAESETSNIDSGSPNAKKIESEKDESEKDESEKVTSEKVGSENPDIRRLASNIKIAIAHNKNDTCETMLFHLFRGSGLKGLCGILPVREEIIRPILCLKRSEIEEYLSEKAISYCTDATNAEDTYTRNRIRHHILPYVEKEICNNAVDHIAEAARQLSQLEDYLSLQTEEASAKCVQPLRNGGMSVDCVTFLSYHPVIRGRLLLDLLKEISGVGKDISSVHIEALLGLFEGETGKQLSLPFGITARRNYGEVLLERTLGRTTDKGKNPEMQNDSYGNEPNGGSGDENSMQDFMDAANGDSHNLKNVRSDRIYMQIEKTGLCQWKEKDGDVSESSSTFSIGEDVQCICSVFPYEKSMEVSQNKYTKWFDYDKIKSTLTFRGRMNGDRISIKSKDGTVGHKKLKEYLINEKVSRQERESLLVLAEESNILWVIGYRMGEDYKITSDTKYVLQVEVILD